MNQNLSEAAMNWMTKNINISKDIPINYSDKEVDHKEYVEGKIYLLSPVVNPWNARLNAVTEKICIKTPISHNNK